MQVCKRHLGQLTSHSFRALATQAQIEPTPPNNIPPPPPKQEPTEKPYVIHTYRNLPVNFARNQQIPVSESVQKDLEEVIRSFRAPIRHAIAYGSGVFRQKGYTPTDQPMLDFVFAVSHPSHWHAINMAQHPHHYAAPMRWFGSGAVSYVQEHGGANVWFNVGVTVGDKSIKYGVISVDSLCRDLLDWETLYISGRLQKPVKILLDDPRIRLANQVNLASALRTSLLLLPEKFDEDDLFRQIAGISYKGMHFFNS